MSVNLSSKQIQDYTLPEWQSLAKKIHEFHHHFLVTAQSWPAFLYAGGRFDPANPNSGLFGGKLLVKACFTYNFLILVNPPRFQWFKAIFISPASMDAHSESPEHCAGRKLRWYGRRTQTNVAKLIGMQTVQPHAIAYVACQACQICTTDIRVDADTPISCVTDSVCPFICRLLGNCWCCVWHPWVIRGDRGMVRRNQNRRGQQSHQQTLAAVE